MYTATLSKLTQDAATGRVYSLPPTLLSTTAAKITLVVMAAALLFAFHIFAGALYSKVSAFGGLALGGFNLALLPVVGGLLYLGSRLLGHRADAPHSDARIFGMVLLCVVLVVALFAFSTFLCKKFSSLPSFSLTDSLKVAGHLFWMSLSIPLFFILIKRIEEERMEPFYTAVSPDKVSEYWEDLGEDLRAPSLKFMNPILKARLLHRLPYRTITGTRMRQAARDAVVVDVREGLRQTVADRVMDDRREGVPIAVGEKQWLADQLTETECGICFASDELTNQEKTTLRQMLPPGVLEAATR